jgi:flavin-dependent dehydrogenase
MNVNKIVIVGAGSAGFISASFLKQTFPNMDITIIESPNYPTVGVGESTLADFTNFRDYLELDEKEFMKATNASYKLGIKFTDFYDVDSGSFYYPFRLPDLEGTKQGLADWYEIKAFYPETDVNDFARCYFPHMTLIERNKFALNNSGEFGAYNPHTDVAYHFDATKFGLFLKEKFCIPRGIKVISASVSDIIMNDSGIEKIILDTGEVVRADLFVDCTGFKSLLLGQNLKEPFISYEDMLPNNRAWATQIPYQDKDNELEGVTNGTAIENGWVWNIPLWSRLGTGYVYSDKYINKEDALEQFKEYLMSDKMVYPRTRQEVDSYSYKDIPMRVGIHERLWVKNVVALGLSGGFIEPLESNGLFSVFWFVRRLAKSLLRGVVSQYDRDAFNYSCREVFQTFAEFVAAHYALSIRRDTKYWQDIGERTFDKTLTNYDVSNIKGFTYMALNKMSNPQFKGDYGIVYVSVGMNYPFFDRVDQKMNVSGANIKDYIDSNRTFFEIKKMLWEEAAEKAPSLNKYLADNIYNEEGQE